MSSPSIVWFRDDLRLADHPALRAALDRGEPVVGLYVLDEESAGIRPLGGAARWWLHHSLASLADDLRAGGSHLVLRRGAAASVVRSLVDDIGAGAVYWNRRYGGAERAVDTDLKDGLRADGVEVESFAANVLFEPWTVKTGSGTPFSVFTPFWNAARNLPAPREPLPGRTRSPACAHRPPATTSTIGSCCPPGPTGRAVCASAGSPARRRRAHACASSSTTTSAPTTRPATNPARERPRCSRRACDGAS